MVKTAGPDEDRKWVATARRAIQLLFPSPRHPETSRWSSSVAAGRTPVSLVASTSPLVAPNTPSSHISKNRNDVAGQHRRIQRNVYDMFDLGKIEFVAAGGEGVVFRAPSRWNGKFKAIKISQLDAAESLMQEGELVKQIFADGPETPCIAQVQEIIQDDIFSQTILISEFYHLGSLRSWLNRECGADGRPRYDIVENFLHDTVRGLMHLHRLHGIVHRDIKPDNLLVKQHSNRDLSVEITDFRMAWSARDEDKDCDVNVNWQAGDDLPRLEYCYCGTVGYLAPEIEAGAESLQVDASIDWYAVGKTFFNVAFRMSPSVDSKTHIPADATESYNQSFIDFLCECVSPNAAIRMSDSEVWTHPYTRDMNWDDMPAIVLIKKELAFDAYTPAPSFASTSSSASFSSTAVTLRSFDAQYMPMYEATEYLDRSLNLHGASPTGTQATIVPSNSAVDVFNGFKFNFFEPSIVDLEPTVALAYVPGAFDISNALFLR
ncbi:kinase-like domain-containing protein [Auriculariales sp. MPI-PUGE-AT-0066]|nr:kinase-like domain-containing protein [Auriculariales sp. MPI-PUGE-AT-0066]